ncbi:N-acyl homoserine lactonase family protein [Priestia megaterium]
MKNYSIWVLEYSRVVDYHKSGVVYGAHNEGYVRLPYSYVVIKGNGHNIMVDVGYNHKEYGKVLGERFNVVDWQSPSVVLKEVGLTPEDIDTVIITHAHFDHFGNVEDFPNATFYMQEKELSKFIWAMSLPHQFQFLMSGVDPSDLLRGVQLAKEGRMQLLDGDVEEFLPGIDIFAAFDTHTYGSQFVRVKQGGSEEDSWVLAGDNAYQFENIEGKNQDGILLPVGLATGSQTEMIFSLDKMLKLVGRDSKRVIPIHEQGITERFPSRTSDKDLFIVEVDLADDEVSKVQK